MRATFATLRKIPSAGWWCAAIAVSSAILWSLVTPVYQVPDEVAHAGYAQFVAERGKPPSGATSGYSDEMAIGLDIWRGAESTPPWSTAFDRSINHRLDQKGLRRSAQGMGLYASNYPPLYYAYEAIPYRLGSGLNYLDRLYLMRMWSALLAGIVALASFLFVRELLPGTPWAWTVGGLGVAWQPMLGFMSGGVNNDDMIYAVGAVIMALLARILRRGLTPRTAAALAVTLSIGVLTKQAVAGLGPAIAIALLVAIRAAPAGQRRRAFLLAASVFAVAGVVAVGYIASGSLYDRPAGTIDGGVGVTPAGRPTPTISGEFNYAWTSFFPRLPGMNDQHDNVYVLRDVYFKGFVGIFGWFETSFPGWVYTLAMFLIAVLLALAGRELWRRRVQVRERWPQLAVGAIALGGMALLVEYAAYRYHLKTGSYFEQGRYLFPALFPLYAAMLALAARGAGQRFARPAGGVIVVCSMAHTLFAMLLVLSRYYA